MTLPVATEMMTSAFDISSSDSSLLAAIESISSKPSSL